MARFKQKPNVVEAVKWDATKESWIAILAIGCIRTRAGKDGSFYIPTMDGEEIVNVGDYVVKDAIGGFYSVEGDVFLSVYEPLTGE